MDVSFHTSHYRNLISENLNDEFLTEGFGHNEQMFSNRQAKKTKNNLGD